VTCGWQSRGIHNQNDQRLGAAVRGADRDWRPRAGDAVKCGRVHHSVAEERARRARMAHRDESIAPGGRARRPNDVRADRRPAGSKPAPRRRIQPEGKGTTLEQAQAQEGSMTTVFVPTGKSRSAVPAPLRHSRTQ